MKRQDSDIYRLIKEGEHQQQDFKYAITSISKIAHSLSAFANTDGGRLLVGVRDDGRIAGVKSEEEIYMIDAAARTFCSPEPVCKMESTQAEGHTILIAWTERSPQRPVRAKEEDGTKKAYIRVKDENIVASPVHLELWRQEDSGEGELIPFTERERRLLGALPESGEGMTLSRFCRGTNLPRKKAVQLLANWIRYGVARIELVDHKWVFFS